MTYTIPVLFSFRRCPYAIRARLALWRAGLKVELVEVALKHKPPELLAASPKGTVPVLVLPSGQVLEQSLDIMRWALAQNDPQGWLRDVSDPLCARDEALIQAADGPFKHWLDRYKYHVRFPELSPEASRAQAVAVLLEPLAQALAQHPGGWLGGAHPVLADAAIFPLVRQFAGVDPTWPLPAAVQRWLSAWQIQGPEAELFRQVMAAA